MLVHQDVTEGIEDDDSNSGITMKSNLGGNDLRRGYQGQRRKEGNEGGSKQGQGLQNMSKNPTSRKDGEIDSPNNTVAKEYRS